MAQQVVLILDFGGQYKELIARRVRECHVYSVVRSGDITPDEIRKIAPIGIILTGGPNSVYDPASPHCDKQIFELGIPVLGKKLRGYDHPDAVLTGVETRSSSPVTVTRDRQCHAVC